MDDPLLVDRPDLADASDLPAHMRIGDWLERLIVSHTLAPGDKLPSEVEIANALGVSRMTLRQALSTIEAKGLIDRRRGRFGGNFVAAPRFEVEQAGLLGMGAGCPLLLITRTSFSESGVAVEFSRDYHRSDRARIRIKSRADGEAPAGDATR